MIKCTAVGKVICNHVGDLLPTRREIDIPSPGSHQGADLDPREAIRCPHLVRSTECGMSKHNRTDGAATSNASEAPSGCHAAVVLALQAASVPPSFPNLILQLPVTLQAPSILPGHLLSLLQTQFPLLVIKAVPPVRSGSRSRYC